MFNTISYGSWNLANDIYMLNKHNFLEKIKNLIKLQMFLTDEIIQSIKDSVLCWLTTVSMEGQLDV